MTETQRDFQMQTGVAPDGSAIHLKFTSATGTASVTLGTLDFADFVGRLLAVEVEAKKLLSPNSDGVRIVRNAIAHEVERTMDGVVLLTFEFADGSTSTTAFPASGASVLAEDIVTNAKLAGATAGSA